MASAHTDEADRRLNLTVGLVVVLACITVVIALRTELSHDQLQHLSIYRLLAVFAMLALASRFVLHVRIKASHHDTVMTDAVMLIGLMLIPGSLLVLCTAIAVTASKITLKLAPVKVAFNAAKATVVVGASVAVGWLFGLAGPFTASTARLPGILAAALVLMITDEVIATPVISFATRTPPWKLFLTNWDVRWGGIAIRLALATLAMFGISRQPMLVVLVLVSMVYLQVLSSNQVRQRAERAAWQKLAQTTDQFNEIDLDHVLNAAVTRASEMFSADEVDVEITFPPIVSRIVRGDAESIRYDGPPQDAPERQGHVISRPLESHDASGHIGELRLRFFGKIALNEREQLQLRSFVAALSTAIRNAAAYAESQRLSAEHEHNAKHDQLTGLANRRQLYEIGDAILAEPSADGRIGLLLIDLNHFKEVNDTLGHVAGDQVLQEVARRIAVAAQPGDLVVRLGGDEFAVLLTGLPTPALAVPRAREILAMLDPPMEIDRMHLVIEASAGVALAPGSGGIEELLRRADVAMYEAKRAGNAVSTYALSRDTADVGWLSLSADLPRAVEKQEFIVEFQPIVDLASGEVLATEALARWAHPDRGHLSPIRFLDKVERSGLLAAFSEAVLEQALHAANTLRTDGFTLPVAVNVSPRSLLDPTFPDTVQARLDGAGVGPELLTIELTESLTLSQLDIVDEVLRRLRDLGIRLALDDFGTGYSSLATLARVPVHELKIDRAFVGAMDTTPADAAVVRSTIDLGRNLDLLVVAEGVESEEQRRRLWEQGCPAGQGHLFGRPMSLDRLLTALHRGYGDRPATLAAPLHDSASVIRLPTRRPTAPQRRDEIG